MSVRRTVGVLLCVCITVAALTAPATAQVLPYWLKIEKILDNSVELANITQAPTGELWLLERSGTIRVYANGVQKTTLAVPVTAACQSGLLDAAFAPDFGSSGTAFIYYIDAANRARVDTVTSTPAGLSMGVHILDLGPAGDDCRPGGDLQVGTDGKLYVATGDLATPAAAQDDASLLGKVLRANLDGSVPADNPSGTLVWAKGFRHGHGLGYNPNTARVGGTFYLTDVGTSTGTTASDEVNQVKQGGNYAWSNGSGPMGGSYVDPLTSWAPASLVNPQSVTALHNPSLGAEHLNALAVAAPTNDAANKGTIKEFTLKGTELEQLDKSVTLFKPDGDLDGTPDAACPTKVNVVEMGNEGELYAANSGSNMGVWRIYRDGPGPREVSAPGSPIPLTVEKSAGNVKLGWENLGSVDAGLAKRHAASGQPANTYQLFEGSLPITGLSGYSHTQVLDTAGTAEGRARLTATLTPGEGNRYYMVAAQGDNLEGSLGKSSSGTERPLPAGATGDYCTTIGYGRNTGYCLTDFVWKLVDYNPNSPTYLQRLSAADFRGRTSKLAIAAKNCGWCSIEVQQEDGNDKKYRDRDFIFLSVYTLTYGYWNVVPPANCQAEITAWATSNNSKTPIFCDEDHDGDGKGDVSVQYDQCMCAPQNFYIDQGQVIYDYVQGAQFAADVEAHIQGLKPVPTTPEVNTEGCD